LPAAGGDQVYQQRLVHKHADNPRPATAGSAGCRDGQAR
jgi:hypothetical protein